jgi:hypothetical protein
MLAPMPKREKDEKGGSGEEEEAEGAEEIDETEGSGCLHLNLVHNRRWLHVLYLDYVRLSIRPLRLQIEQNTTARLIRLAHVFEVLNCLSTREPPHASVTRASRASVLEACNVMHAPARSHIAIPTSPFSLRVAAAVTAARRGD